ncbi:hypothetical protein K402DRAFT_334137 [Aulographum hederae CBS 113979]|uniref:Uncharacterized protein n=1 Tax=Aulographum hederae CBS 113979 TaxID=1176131 RepID=A0A6G1GXV3_9PEZI|nr:hypothetical protein K402DRAFT_334137 [Aulographum hederae CBS 113979]
MIFSLFFLFIATAFASPSSFRGHHWGQGSVDNKALYFLQNDPTGASIVSLELDQYGKVSNAVQTPTGGSGLQGITAATGDLQGPDSLFSQAQVVVGDNFLFTVNAGSNTVSMFKISPHDPTHPKLVGMPVDSMGDFPVSITYASALKTACVLNGGARSGVACFRVDEWFGLIPLDAQLRSISPLNTTNPPAGPPLTASQISFSPSCDFLIADIKGDTGIPGTIFVWPVHFGYVAHSAVATSLPEPFVNFGFTFLDNYRVFMTFADAGIAGLFLDIDPSTCKVAETSRATVSPNDFIASCWASHSKELSTAYAGPAVSPRLAKADTRTGKFAGYIEFDPALQGAYDMVVDGTLLYFIARSADVVVVDLKTEQTIQVLNLEGVVGDRVYWVGMAMYDGGGWSA